MANRTRIYYPGSPGIWPGGESDEVRAAADKQVEKETISRRAQTIRIYRDRVAGR